MDQAARGAALAAAGKHSEAIEQYNAAILAHPTSADYYIKRSTAYQRSADYAAALRDAEIAVVAAIKRAKRELITQAQLRRAIALFCLERYGDAERVLTIVKDRDPKEKSILLWEGKIKAKFGALDEGDERRAVTVKDIPDVDIPVPTQVKAEKREGDGQTANPASDSSTQAAKPGSNPVVKAGVLQTPPGKIRHDWYQGLDTVVLNLLAKGVPKDKATVDIQQRSVNITFPTATDSDFEFSLDPLLHPIIPSESKFNITPTKIEITLKKETAQKWSALESTSPLSSSTITAKSASSTDDAVKRAVLAQAGPVYPTSSRTGPKNWDKVADDLVKQGRDPNAKVLDDEEVEGDEVGAFFKNLYKGAGDETRRAMMKSYQESNGTVLSTNWEEIKKKKVETSPPDGMVAKKWGE